MTIQNQPAIFYVNAALFDCDGTLVNSTGAISEFWRDFGKTRPHVNPDEIIRTSHGCRTFDVIAKWSPEDANVAQVTAWEGAIPDSFGQYAKPIPGAVELVKSFDDFSKQQTADGKQRWAIVTSGTLPLATKWLKLMSITQPDCFITAEKVTKGKPHPQGYQNARNTLGFEDAAAKVVVFEDAPAGITAGKGAGAMIVGICSTYDPEKVRKSGADIVVDDLSSFKIDSYNPATNEFKVVVSEYHYANEEYLQEVA
ncbi:DL-glycerol-3-phosphatase [Yamadazyma tenuis]|uniref:HAD-like protein n=1 Tax=Candida tenuis (strain ATCC 10573 / BCRC 21748 / CBS 615 / JCM 9827 / NBRC 10315 / NRRL Y-1498 / VKM Y-70) TaxID=590646 RepID=G3B746_CANTC|nr:HAD-like protein [Yamadazyma tenuis ATCC 10573]EGV63096.1 HAD-like protein [Yamadazyma tenuis ATCC 10573]WEJ97089.1 DL-glycerol-3-phosphatase [Yamadazyma tenuis]